jgi:hypothetical protein
MSNTNYSYEKDPVSGTRFVSINNNLRVTEEVITREGILKGFVYHTPDPQNISGAMSVFNNDENALLDAVRGRLGQMVYARMLSRLRSKLPQDQGEKESTKDWMKRHSQVIESLKLTDPVVFSIEDAETFRPGERELTPSGILRSINKLQTEGARLLNEGKIQDAVKVFDQVKVYLEKFSQYTDDAMKAANEQLEEEVTT